MKRILIEISERIDIEEFVKSISFVSSKIRDFHVGKEYVEVFISDNADVEKIESDLLSMVKKYKYHAQTVEIFHECICKEMPYYELENENSSIIEFGNGQIGFDEKGLFLMNFFDDYFKKVALDKGAIEKNYPVLLPMEEYSMTGYLKKSPQYSIFCSTIKDNIIDLEKIDESVRMKRVGGHIKEPYFALSPSACFHTYLEYRGKEIEHNTLITFKQNVFRNEGRLNYKEKGRLCDYNVREIVMIGTEDYIFSMRQHFMNKTAECMEKYKLRGNISLASDSFVIPKMQMYRKIQLIDKSKYEMHLKLSEENELSTASFNLHGTAFTDPFDIKMKGSETTVTGCVGYGLQRIVLAFLAQYGNEQEGWPEDIKKIYNMSRHSIL